MIVSEFRKLGVTPKNQMWSWSGISADGNTAVITVWAHELKYKDGKPIISTYVKDLGSDRFIGSHGNNERIQVVKYALENLDGLVRVIVCQAKEGPNGIDVEHPKISRAHQTKWLMKIESFNETTGEYRAHLEKML